MYTGSVTPRAELDGLSSEPGKPHGIISIDGPSPYEIDDAIAVTIIPDKPEAYGVHVFAADTSGLYADDNIVEIALDRVEARYHNPNTTLEAYEPMLPLDVIRDLQLKEGMARAALVISFVIGRDQPPSDITVGFGQIEVRKNFVTSAFNKKCREQVSYDRYVQASALILRYLYPETRASRRLDTDGYHQLLAARLKRGANINSPFVVSGNHLAGHLVTSQELAIYRVHQIPEKSSNGRHPVGIARFSRHPAPHDGLGVDVYTRVSSALRRLEDFVMHGLLRRYAEGQPLEARDYEITERAIGTLNQRIDAKLRHGTVEPSDEDHWINTDI